MAVYSGPKVVTDGMIMHLDKYNEESYQGEPTTNLAVNFSAWSKDASGHSSQGAVTLSSDNWTATIVDTDDNTRHYAYINATPGTTYTFSNKYRNLGGTSPTFRYQVSWRDSSNNNISYAWVQTAALGITDIGGWQQATYTATAPSGTVQILWYMQDGADYTGYTHNFEIKEMQFEAKPHMTKWVDGTRPVADGWQDLSGEGHHADLTSLTYSATNVPGTNVNDFSFNGTSNRCTLGTLGTVKTILAWIKADTNHSGIVFGPHVNGLDNWFGVENRLINIYATESADVNNFSANGTTYMDNGGWYYIAMTINHDTNTIINYLDGVQDTSVTVSHSIGIWGGAAATIGRRGTNSQRYFDGEIDTVSIYNRILTAIEVLQNFNASKGRYGL